MELSEKQTELFKYIQSLFNKPVYAVGGCVRDILLDKEPKDYDFCSSMSTEEIKDQLKGKHRAYLIGEKFGVIGFRCLDEDIEITSFRKEEYFNGSRKPNVTFGTNLREDLSRRDFTINSMAINTQTFELIDYFDGQKDLKNRVVRSVGSPKIRFREDPLRILRCIRFATTLDFLIEEKTLKKMQEAAYSLIRISKERWVDEFEKILKSDNVYNGLYLLWRYRIFNFTLPELAIQWGYDQNSRYHNLELWDHTAHVVESTQRAGESIEMLWAALFHDIGKPATRTDKFIPIERRAGYGGRDTKSNYVMHERVGAEIAARLCNYLKFSNKKSYEIIGIIRNHLKDDSPLRIYDNMHKSEFAKEFDITKQKGL